jgi:hypothetical protein
MTLREYKLLRMLAMQAGKLADPPHAPARGVGRCQHAGCGDITHVRDTAAAQDRS